MAVYELLDEEDQLNSEYMAFYQAISAQDFTLWDEAEDYAEQLQELEVV